MNKPYDDANKLYSKHGDNFLEAVEWMQANGVVISLPNTFLMGYYCKQDAVTRPVEYGDADCIFVVLCVGDPQAALTTLVSIIEFIAYDRAFRGDDTIRIISSEKLHNLL